MILISSLLTMCDDTLKRSDFYKDDDKHKEACEVLREMKALSEVRSKDMITIILPNGARVSSTNSERLKDYEKYSERKTGYFYQLK